MLYFSEAVKEAGAMMPEDIREIPTYTLTDSARYLRVSVGTLRRWLLGYDFPGKSGKKRHSEPLINVAGNDPTLLSFYNLVEGHILSVFRKKHGITMRNVRKALDHLERNYPSPHPLADYSFLTDGLNIFIEKFSELEDITSDGQMAWRKLLKQYLDRVEYDDRNFAVRLFPFTRNQENVDVRLVVIDPKVSFGRPVIKGTGVPTRIIAERWGAGELIKDLSKDYGRREEDIEEAIRFERSWKAA